MLFWDDLVTKTHVSALQILFISHALVSQIFGNFFLSTRVPQVLAIPDWRVPADKKKWNRPALPRTVVDTLPAPEISCFQGFHTLTSGDPKWPLTYMKNNRDNLHTKGYQHTKFEVQATFNSWDIVFTRFSYFNLWWPQMTFDLHEKQ